MDKVNLMLSSLRVLCFCFSFILSLNVLANAPFEARPVNQIIIHDWGRILIYLNGGLTTKEPCERSNVIVLKKDNQFFDQMYSAVLAAYHGGGLIGGWVNGCDDRIKAPILTRLDLLPK